MSSPHSSREVPTEEAGILHPSANREQPWKIKSFRAQVGPFCWAVVAIAAITWVASRLGLNVLTGGFLYLITVVVAAAFGGFWSGTLTSLVATICIDYFFLPPVYHFDINDPMDVVALGTFEFTALVITLLHHQVQLKATEAAEARQINEKLFHVARELLTLETNAELGNRIAALICKQFELNGVMLFDASNASVYVAGNCAPDTESGIRSASSRNLSTFDAGSQSWFCALHSGARAIGGLALCGSAMPSAGAQAIASLCAITFERARSAEKENRAEAARQTEQLRSAVVEALAHQIKTPLCVIQVASSALPSLGELSEMQAELVASIDDQSTKLNDVVTRLLGAADLTSARIEPQFAPVKISDLVRASIERLDDPAQRERFRVFTESAEDVIAVDARLIVIALTQVVENAVKYSFPRSLIEVRAKTGATEITLCVHNQGGTIPPADRERIFERFYRTAAARKGPVGTGLGLSIAKRIIDAHQGRVWVESSEAEGTTFNIVLPRSIGDGSERPPVNS